MRNKVGFIGRSKPLSPEQVDGLKFVLRQFNGQPIEVYFRNNKASWGFVDIIRSLLPGTATIRVVNNKELIDSSWMFIACPKKIEKDKYRIWNVIEMAQQKRIPIIFVTEEGNVTYEFPKETT
jgi:hypothetical protein